MCVFVPCWCFDNFCKQHFHFPAEGEEFSLRFCGRRCLHEAAASRREDLVMLMTPAGSQLHLHEGEFNLQELTLSLRARNDQEPRRNWRWNLWDDLISSFNFRMRRRKDDGVYKSCELKEEVLQPRQNSESSRHVLFSDFIPVVVSRSVSGFSLFYSSSGLEAVQVCEMITCSCWFLISSSVAEFKTQNLLFPVR